MNALVLAFNLWCGAETIRVDAEDCDELIRRAFPSDYRKLAVGAYHAALRKPAPGAERRMEELRELWDEQRSLGVPDMNTRALAFNLWAGAEAVRIHLQYGEVAYFQMVEESRRAWYRSEVFPRKLRLYHPLVKRRLTKQEARAISEKIDREQRENYLLEQWLERQPNRFPPKQPSKRP